MDLYIVPIEERYWLLGGLQRTVDRVCPDGWHLEPCAECAPPMQLQDENVETERNRVFTPRRSNRDGRYYIRVFAGWL
jgi:hypothetical protein